MEIIGLPGFVGGYADLYADLPGVYTATVTTRLVDNAVATDSAVDNATATDSALFGATVTDTIQE